jgi:hypothetical protein
MVWAPKVLMDAVLAVMLDPMRVLYKRMPLDSLESPDDPPDAAERIFRILPDRE